MSSILGAHMSTAGGYHKAVERAAAADCDCVQMHLVSPRQWPQNRRPQRIQPKLSTSPIPGPNPALEVPTAAEVEKFADALSQSTVRHPLSHSSYLINLAAPDKVLWKKSIDAFVIELQRAAALSIPYVVLHPGAFTTGSEAEGVKAIIKALNEVHGQTRGIRAKCLLETTAGQGSSLGWRFEQLAEMISGVHDPDRLGVCFDTCHVFAAGYPLTELGDYRSTMREFDKLVGLKQIKAFHLNDSKRELASRIDRHEHIGQGCLGEAAFAHLLADQRFRKIPMYLETPKGKDDQSRDFDVLNLKVLRRLAKHASS